MRTTHRNRKRGSALAISMIMLVVVTVSGTALLSVSQIHRADLVKRGIQVRLAIAAEAGLETARGRFAIVPGAQANWNGLLPNASWNNIGSAMIINGAVVQVQAMRVGAASEMRARVRGVASIGHHSHAVEYTLGLASTVPSYALFGHQTLQISGSRVRVTGDVHTNANVHIPGQGWVVDGAITAGTSVHTHHNGLAQSETANAPKVTMPSMPASVPATSAATVIMNGDRNLNGYVGNNPNADGWTIVWVKGKLEIRGSITGKVWFLADKDIVVKGSLTPANQASALRMYTLEEFDAPGSSLTLEGVFLAKEKLKLAGSNLQVKGLLWSADEIQISGSNPSITGAIISNGEIKIAGSDVNIVYDPSYSDFIVGYGSELRVMPESWRAYQP